METYFEVKEKTQFNFKDDNIYVFTDGSCKENNYGGWGSFITYKDNSICIADGDFKTTNNKMELRAILESLKKIKIQKDRKYNILIFSDSSYVIKTLLEENTILKQASLGKNVKNYDLWAEFIAIFIEKFNSDNINLFFFMIRGHFSARQQLDFNDYFYEQNKNMISKLGKIFKDKDLVKIRLCNAIADDLAGERSEVFRSIGNRRRK